MKKFKFCSVLLIGLMLMGSVAFAFDANDHVISAPNGKGDLIFFPWFLTASGGWETKLTVINTSPTLSTVAKVVIRSHNWSEELLDFLIYLSPNDVWTGSLKFGSNGAYLYSEDDSILRKLPVSVSGVVENDFASKTNPLTQNLFSVSCPDDSKDRGYVEVIESTSVAGLPVVSNTTKVAKPDIYKWYHAAVPNGPVVTKDSTPNILTAYQEFSNSFSHMSSLIRAEVFADWNNLDYLTTTAVSGITNRSRNTIGELEAAMAKSNVALPYINSTNGDIAIHIFNFPTKMSLNNADSACDNYVPAIESPYFNTFTTLANQTPVYHKCEEFTPEIYDLLENTTTTTGSPFSGGEPGVNPEMCNEVEFILTAFTDSLFTEGWVRYNWTHTPTIKTFATKDAIDLVNTYTGTPVLPVVMYFKSSGSMSQAAAAWDNGLVKENAETMEYYQNSENLIIPPIIIP